MSFKDNYERAELEIQVWRDVTPGLPAVERAIAFVQTRGTATSAELHVVLELKPDDLPSWHLDEALEKGWLIKAGKYWTLGVLPASMRSVGLIDVVEVESV